MVFKKKTDYFRLFFEGPPFFNIFLWENARHCNGNAENRFFRYYLQRF